MVEPNPSCCDGCFTFWADAKILTCVWLSDTNCGLLTHGLAGITSLHVEQLPLHPRLLKPHLVLGDVVAQHTLPTLYVEFSPPRSVRCSLLGQFVMLGWAQEQGSSDWSQTDQQGWPDWSWALVSWAQMGVWVTFIISHDGPLFIVGVSLAKFPNCPPSSTWGYQRNM